MRFAKHNNIYKIGRITGSSTNPLATTNILGISFCDDPINENEENEIEVISLEPTENAYKTSNSEILDQVVGGLNSINKDLGTNYRLSKIYYVPSQLARSSQLEAREAARVSESASLSASELASVSASELAARLSEFAARGSLSRASLSPSELASELAAIASEYESILAISSQLAARGSEYKSIYDSIRGRVYRLLIRKLIQHYHEGGKFEEL